MATITSYGLAQEYRVVCGLCRAQATRLQGRGITEEKLTGGSDLVKIMQDTETAALNAETAKELLTEQEEMQRNGLGVLLHAAVNAVKKQFGKGAKEGKDFRVGENLAYSTPKTLQWADDVVKAYPKYRDDLQKQGIMPTDIDSIKASAAALEATDTQQETSKRIATQTTATANAAFDAVVKFIDAIHSAVIMEFAQEPAVRADFEAAKKLRYQAPPKPAKSDGKTDANNTTPVAQPAIAK
ncbi:MAG: hypothetical protein ABSC53_03160 [Bacteroidota bacterium]